MEIQIECPVCLIGKSESFSAKLPQQNECVYALTCPNGHAFDVNILYHPFQKLFEIGVYAIVDGYYREAIGSFTASLERFMELFVRVAYKVRELDDKEFDNTWKLMSRLSERQLGAFVLSHLMEFNSSAVVLGSSDTNLRNRVIHQGYFPRSEETIIYGNKVLDCINTALKRIHESPDHFNVLIGVINEYGNLKSDEPRTTYLPYHMIGTNHPLEEPSKRVEDFIASIQNDRSKF